MASFKVRRQVLGTGGGRFGGTSNYSDIDTAGRLTMAGTAKVYRDQWVPAPNFFLQGASTACGMLFDSGSMVLIAKQFALSQGAASVFSETQAGSAFMPVMTNAAASPSTASMVFATATVSKPTDAATTGCINVRQVWTVVDARLTANSSMAFKVGGAYLTNAASLRTAASCGAAGSYPATNACTFCETSLGYLPSWGANDVAMVMVAGMDWASASTSNGSGFAILGYKLRYVADCLGTVTT